MSSTLVNYPQNLWIIKNWQYNTGFYMIYMEHPEKKRFYWLLMEQDLFGTWCVKRVYGGLYNQYNRQLVTPCQNRAEAAKMLTEYEFIRRQRGYIYANTNNPDNFALRPQTIDEVDHKKTSQIGPAFS